MSNKSADDLTAEPRAVVLLAPTGRFSHVESFRMIRPTEEGGKYEIRGVTPGSYSAFAFEGLDRSAAQDPDFLARLGEAGKPVEVHEGEQVSLDLDVLPAPPGGSEPATESEGDQ
jgi:hypothetical protein